MINKFHLITNCSKKLKFLLTILDNILFIFQSNSKFLLINTQKSHWFYWLQKSIDFFIYFCKEFFFLKKGIAYIRVYICIIPKKEVYTCESGFIDIKCKSRDLHQILMNFICTKKIKIKKWIVVYVGRKIA